MLFWLPFGVFKLFIPLSYSQCIIAVRRKNRPRCIGQNCRWMNRFIPTSIPRKHTKGEFFSHGFPFCILWSLYYLSAIYGFWLSLQILIEMKIVDSTTFNYRAFNFTYRYIDDVLSINNSRFAEFLSLIYPSKLEAKETTDEASSASFLDVCLEFDDSGQLSTKIYDRIRRIF
jgi:hypothetical protein